MKKEQSKNYIYNHRTVLIFVLYLNVFGQYKKKDDYTSLYI